LPINERFQLILALACEPWMRQLRLGFSPILLGRPADLLPFVQPRAAL